MTLSALQFQFTFISNLLNPSNYFGFHMLSDCKNDVFVGLSALCSQHLFFGIVMKESIEKCLNFQSLSIGVN